MDSDPLEKFGEGVNLICVNSNFSACGSDTVGK